MNKSQYPLEREIATQLKYDIFQLWNIAKSYANKQAAQDADELYEMILAGLIDYELWWRGYYGGEK